MKYEEENLFRFYFVLKCAEKKQPFAIRKIGI